MRKRTRVIIIILGGLFAGTLVICVIYFGFLWLILGGIFAPPQKPPVGIVGSEMMPDTKSTYDFIQSNTGLDFPKGTKVDVYGDGFVFTYGCFTVPAKNIESFLNSNNINFTNATEPINFLGVENLTVPNQKIPPQGMFATLRNERGLWRMYFDKKSGRLWIEHASPWPDY